MSSVYDNVSGVEVAEWDGDSDGSDPAEQRHCKIEELYYEPHTGNIVLTFEDRDTGRSFDVSIPVKADPDWNGFVESLPTWDNAD